MKLNLFVLVVGIITLLSACQSNKGPKSANDLDPNTHEVIVEEVIHGGTYTYLRVLEYDENYWVALPQQEVKVGETYYFEDELVMNDFESKELERTFEEIYFILELRDHPSKPEEDLLAQSPHGRKPVTEKWDITLNPKEGCITIAELFSNRKEYESKVVKIKGQVVKFSPNIMKKNWIHIQDGTDDSGNFDLTITTLDTIEVGVILTFEGKIALDKDFGAGYSYEVIMEEAKVQN